MARKKVQKVTKSRGRNWTIEETNIFAETLADLDLNFASTLDKKTLKSSSNKAVFFHIQKELVI